LTAGQLSICQHTCTHTILRFAQSRVDTTRLS
jgi:hypothetical protein